MSRLIGNWLNGYREYTSESEAPETYHMWVGLSAMASAVRRNVWLNQGIYLLYPNLFIILVAPPGKIGKSTVLRLGRKLIQQLDEVVLGPDSVTAEELMRFMGVLGAKNGKSELTIYSSELSSLIEPSGVKMLQFLTDIYDCDFNPKGWTRKTKTSGSDTIKFPVINLLGATTPSWIAEGFPESVISHGFTGRTIFVYEDTTRFGNPFPDEPDPKLMQILINDLDHMSRIEGCFTWSEEAKEEYAEFYEELRVSIPEDHRIESYHYRKRTHILKIAMLLSLAESDNRVIRPRDIEAAKDVLHMVEENMPRTFSAVGKYEYAADLERISQQIYRAGGMPISRLLEHNYFVGDHQTLQGIVGVLVASNNLTLEHRGKEKWLIPTGHAPIGARSSAYGLPERSQE